MRQWVVLLQSHEPFVRQEIKGYGLRVDLGVGRLEYVSHGIKRLFRYTEDRLPPLPKRRQGRRFEACLWVINTEVDTGTVVSTLTWNITRNSTVPYSGFSTSGLFTALYCFTPRCQECSQFAESDRQLHCYGKVQHERRVFFGNPKQVQNPSSENERRTDVRSV